MAEKTTYGARREDYDTFDEYADALEAEGKPEWREGVQEAWDAYHESVEETIREHDERQRNRTWAGRFWDRLCFLLRR